MTGPDITAHLHRLRARLTGQIDRQIRDRPPQPPLELTISEGDAGLLLTLIDQAIPIEPSARGPANKPVPATGVRMPATALLDGVLTERQLRVLTQQLEFAERQYHRSRSAA